MDSHIFVDKNHPGSQNTDLPALPLPGLPSDPSSEEGPSSQIHPEVCEVMA